MAEETYDIIICGAGSGGDSSRAKWRRMRRLVLDAGPFVPGKPEFGVGSPDRALLDRRSISAKYQPDTPTSNQGRHVLFIPDVHDRG